MTRTSALTRSILVLVALGIGACGGEAERPDAIALTDSAIEEADSLTVEALPEPVALSVAPVEVAPAPEPTASPPIYEGETVDIEVRTGENLVLLAEWSDTSVEELVALNGLDVTAHLQVGQSLAIPSIDDSEIDFQMAREDFAEARLQRYLDARGGLVTVREHTVTTGETAWYIARDQAGVPTWVLSAYNGESNLDRLRHGDVLYVPVLGDDVALLELAEDTGEPAALSGGIGSFSGEPTVFDGIEAGEIELEAADEGLEILTD